MRLFRAKQNFQAFPAPSYRFDDDGKGKVFEGQLFAVADETKLPDPRDKYPGNLKPYYEEIVPNAFLVKQFTQVAKAVPL